MSTAQFWEARYAQSGQVWSGRVNPTLADVASALAPGRALDLGCGEGGDAIWLAQRGWLVTAVDISTTALARGREAAMALPAASGRIDWVAADLTEWRPTASYDLVSACFLQSPVELPRTEILGGSVLIISHAAPPPWAPPGHPHPAFAGPAEEVAELGLDSSEWELVLAEVREREARGPDGQTAMLSDSVVRARRAR